MTYNVLASPGGTLDLRDWSNPCIEPSLTEILSDPMMDLVFRRDSLHRDHVEKLLRDQAERLAATSPWRPTCNCA